MPLAKRVIIYSGEYRDLLRAGWYPSAIAEHIHAFKVDPNTHEFSCWMIKEDELGLDKDYTIDAEGAWVYTGDGIQVFLKNLPIEFIQHVVEQTEPAYVVPYWWPSDPYRTIKTAEVTMAVCPAITRPGIMAIGMGSTLIEFINEVTDRFDLIVLGPDNLGDSPEHELYRLASQGVFRGEQRYHLACGIVPNEATLTYGCDFTHLRNEESDAG
jgi:hypothetical protein